MRPSNRVRVRSALVGLAATLLIVGSVAHHGGARARQGAASAPKSGVTCHTEYAPMRDGTLLATDVYLPPTPGRYPVILQRTPYGLRLGHGCFQGISDRMAFWAEHGYVALTQDSRGTFRSEGTFRPIFQEQADGYDAIEWAAAQPWSNGRVGMTGSSYFGVTQWQAALMTPPHLVAIAPGQTASDHHDNWTYMNGVFDLWFAQSWILHFFAPDEYRRQLIAKGVASDDARKASDEYVVQNRQHITKWVSKVPLASFPDFRTLAPYYYEWLEHPNYDDYWAKVDVETQWANIKVPALISGGWGDLFAIGSVRSFEGMRTHGGSAVARSGTMLVMQPGGHGGSGVVGYGPTSDGDLQDVQLRFFDHHVKGVETGIDREPRAQLFVQVPPDTGTEGSGFWITGDTFPLPGTQKLRFHLRSGGRANTRWGDGVLDAGQPSHGPDDTLVYDPNNPVPSHGGGLCCLSLGFYFASGAQDQSLLELRNDVLSYTSTPLTEDLAIIGPVTVKFWAKSSARDTDFTAKLVDVHPDGFAQNVLDRIVRARFRHGSKSAPSLIEPGMPYDYDIDLGYTATVFKRAHRVRLDISSSNFPHLARNQNTGNAPETDNRLEVAKQTVLHNPTYPAYLELSVAPGVTIPRP